MNSTDDAILGFLLDKPGSVLKFRTRDSGRVLEFEMVWKRGNREIAITKGISVKLMERAISSALLLLLQEAEAQIDKEVLGNEAV